MNKTIRAAAVAAVALAAGQASYAPAANAAESLEARVQRLEDEATIRVKLDEYMDLLGDRDWDNYIKLWSKDADLIMAEGVRHGRDDIKERMSGASERMANAAVAAKRPQRQRGDVLSNIRVQVHGDTATARSRFTFLGEGDDGQFRVTGSGWYTDTWIREEGEWRIKSRAVNWDLLAGQTAEQATKNAEASRRGLGTQK